MAEVTTSQDEKKTENLINLDETDDKRKKKCGFVFSNKALQEVRIIIHNL